MTPKDFVQKIYSEKAKNDSNSSDLANMLDILSKTVFGNINRFVFELLQNADDAPVKENLTGLEVEFKLLDEYLVFSHNGKHFTEDDVTGISSAGSRASEKDKDNEKTGYKGIGFKSVFGTSDEVHIRSDKFTFRFDKNFTGWTEGDEYPWQVIPIWTDEVPKGVSEFINPSKVNTLIRIDSRSSVSKEIKAVLDDCQIILFLRNVNKITFQDGQKAVLTIEKKVGADKIQLVKNGTALSDWMLKEYVVPIPSVLHQQLGELTDTECPKKLKAAKNTKLTFAACLEDDELKSVARAVMYCYLPTKVSKGFPFLINGDFLTNAERTDFLPNIWNQFLFGKIAIKQLEWLQELNDSKYRFQVLRLLKGRFPTNNISDIEAAYNLSLEKGIGAIAFLPDQTEKQLLKVGDSIVDTHQVCTMFKPRFITDFLETKRKIVSIKMEQQSILIDLGAEAFKFEQITKLITTGRARTIKDTKTSTNVILFLFNSTIDGKNSAWLSRLHELPFIADEKNELKTPKEIFFPLESNPGDDFSPGSLSFINSKVLDYCREYDDVIKWLRDLGVNEPTEIEIVRKSILPMISAGTITAENAMPVLRFVFKTYCSGLLNDKDYAALSGIPVLTTNGLKNTQESYLPDEFNPDQKLSTILVGANFINVSYANDPSEFLEWKKFLKRIGVRDNLSIQVVPERIERTAFIAQYPYTVGYFEWIDENEYYPSLYAGYRNSGQHYLSNFTLIEFREHLKVYTFSKMFWRQMLSNWGAFKQQCDLTTYYYRGGSDNVPCFIQYFVRHFATIPCTDGKMYVSTEVYSQNLKATVNGFFPVADFEGHLTKEQAEFFGFKREVSFIECLAILSKLEKQPISADVNRQIKELYDEIIGKSKELTADETAALIKWRKKARLLTLNNTFQPVTGLFCFNIAGVSAPVNSEIFVRLPNTLSLAEISAFCHVFKIPFITLDKLQFSAVNAVSDQGLRQSLLRKARYIALIYAYSITGNYPDIIRSITQILNPVQFKQAEKLNLTYSAKDGAVVYNHVIKTWNDSSGFYFTGKWNSPIAIYDICNQLCGLLNLKNAEREMALVLQLNESDLYQWLLDRGYPVEYLSTDEYIIDATVETDDTENVEEFNEIPVHFETFSPAVKAKEIDYRDVRPVIKQISSSTIKLTKQFATLATPEAKVNVGRWSEEFVFSYLKQNPQIFTKIEWVNEKRESGLPYDFKLLENGIPKVYEVKGTPSADKNVVVLPSSEWKVLFEKGAAYSFFRVYSVGSKDATFERIDNPKALIEQGLLIPDPIELHL